MIMSENYVHLTNCDMWEYFTYDKIKYLKIQPEKINEADLRLPQAICGLW